MTLPWDGHTGIVSSERGQYTSALRTGPRIKHYGGDIYIHPLHIHPLTLEVSEVYIHLLL